MNEIRYAQCWEDPRLLADALVIGPEDDVVSIASGGDNTLALLLGNPRSLVAIDSNPAQVFLLELKIHSLQKLEYLDFVSFLGARPCQKRERLYLHVRSSLSEAARKFWDARGPDLARGVIHCGKLERYFSVFRRFILARIHRLETTHRLLALKSLEEQRAFYCREWNNRRWQWFVRLFFSRFVFSHMGRETAFFRYAVTNSVGEELLRRTGRGLCEIPVQDNFFLQYMLTGKYGSLETTHPYLREANFEFLKKNAGRVQLAVGKLQDYLRKLSPGSVSKLNCSDIFEYVSCEEYGRMLAQMLRVCRPNGRLAYWTLLVPRHLPADLSGRLRLETALSEQLAALDRAFFYGSFNVAQIIGPGVPSQFRVTNGDTSHEAPRTRF